MAENFVSSVSSEEFDKALLGGLDAANGKFAKPEDIPTVPTKLSELENDAGYLKSFAETDPTVPAWAKTPEKPEYTAQEVGARPDSWTPSAADVGADPTGTAVDVVALHNVAPEAHNDIRLLIEGLANRLNALADSDDTTLDQMSEIVAYIKSNKTLIDSITISKVNVSDIIDNLTTNVSNKPLSAAQGVILKSLIDSLSSGKLDVTAIADWAKAATKPSYTKNEVGLGNVDNVKQYSASNPPPYPVTSVNGATGAVTVAVPEIVQATGDSESAVMSQKAVTDAIQNVIESLATPIVGTVDEDNNIILGGDLADGEYTLKYLNQGEYIEIGKLTISSGSVDVPPDTTLNWSPGVKIDSSTGAETTGNAQYSASDYISIVDGYTYTLTKNTTRSEGCKVVYYNADKNFISTSGDVIVSTQNQVSATIPLIDGAAFFRVRLYGTASALSDSDYTLTATKE